MFGSKNGRGLSCRLFAERGRAKPDPAVSFFCLREGTHPYVVGVQVCLLPRIKFGCLVF